MRTENTIRRVPHAHAFADTGRRLVVLAYHGVPNRDHFASQVDLLQRTFHLVGVDEVRASLHEGRRLPERAALITFDDGCPTVFDHALPVLSERGLPAAVFVVSGLLGTDMPFWWDEVQALVGQGASTSFLGEGQARSAAEVVRALKRLSNEDRLRAMEALRATASGPKPRARQLTPDEVRTLDRAGIAVGNHSHTHPCLDRCSEGDVLRELDQAQDVLEACLGHRPRILAYPNGGEDQRVRRAAARVGIDTAFLFDHRVGAWPPADPLRISRLRVNADAHPARFRHIVRGWHPLLHHALGRP